MPFVTKKQALNLITSLALVQSPGAWAQTESKQSPNLPLKVEFKFAPWNKSSSEKDSGILLLRDRQSHQTVKLILTEEKEDSGTFTGQFFLRSSNGESLDADVFIPSQEIAEKESLQSIDALINGGFLLKKPYLLRRLKKKQIMTVYVTEQEAFLASQSKKGAAKAVVDPVAIEAARKAAVAAEQERLARLAQEQEANRLKKEEEARLRQEELKKEQERLSAEERLARIKKAKELSALALKDFQGQRFVEAEANFRKSIELDPSETTYYFQYGATLYKNQKYNEALVAFKLANDKNVNPHEKSFYQGLCYMKLKEYNAALKEFEAVTSSPDKALGPSASFFTGVIHFSRENYKASKAAFEKTIDTSDDTQLDAQAEAYIEQIASIEQYLAMLEKRFTATVTTGLMYDSNILLVSNAASAPATDKAGFRGLLNANLEYRLIFNDRHELEAAVSYTDMYSVDSKFKPNATLQFADPQILAAKIPYKWKGKLFGKPYIFSVSPGYESLYLNADGVGTREMTMGSSVVTTEQTFVVNNDLISIIRLDWRGEDSKLQSVGTADATKVLLGNNNIWFMDQKKTTALLFNWSYLSNQSPADDNAFGKFELVLGYLKPVLQKSSWTSMLMASSSDYSRSSANRKDSNLNFSTSLSSPLTEKLQGILAAGYETNTSTLEASTYNKYTLTATLNWNINF
ncbi:MAG: hypothetical protein RJB66_2048 [Pseudomonadota bacterium]|jgi:tetratricopeptide (TPR) repeat protein